MDLSHPPACPPAIIKRPRPRLALVIGSGGVRSASAVGVMDTVVRAGLRPDLIVGCSSGAVFGAPLALGLSAEMTMRLATSLWSPELTEQRRWMAYLQLIAPRMAGFGRDFSLRSERLIVQRLESLFKDLRLEDLRTQLRIAATDAATGEPVVLSTGSIVRAVQASMAVPFLWPSVEIDGRHLVDGVVSNPLPLSAAADATVVLALGFRGDMPRRVNRISRLIAQVSTSLINNLYDARLSAARASGQCLIEIEPVWSSRIGLWDPSALNDAFESGRKAAALMLPNIERALDLPPREIAA
jgi:NTE family protein